MEMSELPLVKVFKMFRSRWLAAALAAGLATPFARAAATHGIIATVHPAATEAGLAVLKQGGNAIDATVAAALTLGVVDGENSGIGGGCFILIRTADGSFHGIDGRETAPAAATRGMFVRNGKADSALSQTGALASGTPGALAAYAFALEHFGRKKLDELILPAADLAETGFKIDSSYANDLKSVASDLGRFESARKVFFRSDGKILAAGDWLKQPDLAKTYRAIAEDGVNWFYRGPFADALDAWMTENQGLLRKEDLRTYRVQIREPVVTTYRGFEIVGFPPPSSGGVHVTQILNVLENFDMNRLDSVTRLHVIAEAMKLAFADRAFWLGDPDFAPVPRGLVDKNYAAQLAGMIRLTNVAAVSSHGTPPGWQTNLFTRHTTHFSVADVEGNWVACTATINTSFGSKVLVPGTGVILNNQMDDFSAQPGVANYFGLIGAEANAIAPGKRPLSSMSPTLVLKDGKPLYALGAAGGPKIISDVVLELVNLLDRGMTPRQAVEEPRIHHQWVPDELLVEKTLPQNIKEGLRARGHKVRDSLGMGVSQIVGRTKDGSAFEGAADPRAGGTADGW